MSHDIRIMTIWWKTPEKPVHLRKESSTYRNDIRNFHTKWGQKNGIIFHTLLLYQMHLQKRPKKKKQ